MSTGGTLHALAEAMALSKNDLIRLEQSANSLSPLQGGRHAHGEAARWTLEQQRRFVGSLLRRWIDEIRLA